MSMNSSERKFIELVTTCDSLIKAGRLSEVADIIKELNFASVPRESCQPLAKVCRRAGLISAGLRLLQPIIRQEKVVLSKATDSEVSEYSVLLSRNGSIAEALTLLCSVNPTTCPESLLYTAYCHISQWDYEKSIVFLEDFLDSTADDYSKLIARVNLIASYIVTLKLDEAAQLLDATIPVAKRAGAERLVGNCFELWGQVHFWQSNFTKSREALNQAISIFGSSQSYDQLLIHKTESIMNAIESHSVEPLLAFKKEALDRKHRESVREADLFLLKVKFNQKDMDHLIFGTPMLPYRQRIQHVLQANPSDSYLFGNSESKVPLANCLDLRTGILETRTQGESFDTLNAGKKIHRVLASLMKDYYVPRNLGTLFSELYPEEFFDINSSPFRVRQLMMRTRQWLKENKLPATIIQSQNAYSLSIHGDFAIRVHLSAEAVDAASIKLHLLQSRFGTRAFSAEEACNVLACSRTAFRRWADWALEKNCLTKSGISKATRYQLSSAPSQANFSAAA